MPVRVLGHIARRLLLLAAGVLVVSGILFMALTHTRVGRDFVRAQLEAAFHTFLNGQLQIGRLDGNLIRGLYATHVRFYLPDGRLLLSIDSVALRPSWRLLLQRTLALRRLELFHPKLFLYYEHGRWHWPQRADTTAVPKRSPWALSIAELRLHDGVIQTSRIGPAPEAVQQQKLFDYTRTRLDSLTLQATLEYYPDRLLLDLLQVRAHLTRPDRALRYLSGQLLYQEGRWLLPRLELALDKTLLSLSGQLIPGTSMARSALELELHTGTLDFTELRQLFPALPLQQPIGIAGRLHGTLDGLVLDQLELTTADSRLQLEGTLLGLPDSLDFDLLIVGTGLKSAVLAAYWPTAPFPLRTGTPATLRLEMRGLLDFTPLRLQRLEGRGHLQGLPGMLEGLFRLARKDADAPLAYEVQARLRNVQPTYLWPNSPLLPSSLTGLAVLHGQGSRQFDLHLRLDPRPFGGNTDDSLLFTLQRSDARFWATFVLPQQRGHLTATAFYQVTPETHRFRIQAIAQQFDLGPYLHPDTLHTQVNATLSLEGSGHDWPHLAVTAYLALDSSFARRTDQSWRLLPASLLLQLTHPDTARYWLQVSGDLLSADLRGNLPPSQLLRILRHWQHAFARAFHRQTDKPFYRSPHPAQVPPLASDLPRLSLQGQLQVHRLDWLQPLVGLPAIRTDLTGTLRTRADADTLQLILEFQADTLQIGFLRQQNIRGRLQLATGRVVDRSLIGLFEWQSARLQQLRQVRLVGYLQPGGMQVSLSSQPDSMGETLRLTATLDLMDRFNRLTLQEFFWQVRNYRWHLTRPARLDLYADAVVIYPTILYNQPVTDTTAGRIELRGLLSAQPTDTAYVALHGIALQELTHALGRARKLSGRLDGELSLVSAFGMPQLAGFLRIHHLHYDRHPLGTLRLVSHYIPGSPWLALDARLDPDPTTGATNRLRLFGTVRLPSITDAGQLDLHLETRHADAFFFTYIFPDLIANVQGYFVGRGRITGTFRRPIFNAALQLHAGAFEIPRFNLHYQLEGSVLIDEIGLLLDGVYLQDPGGGQARVDGRIFFNDYQFFSFGLTARLEGLQVMNVTYSRNLPFYGKIWGQGTFTLSGPLYSARLQTADGKVLSQSEIYIPLAETGTETDEAFIIFADSTGRIPKRPTRRPNLLAGRPPGERPFLDGLDLDLNLLAPQGTTVRLVIDPLLGDIINARGSGRLQIIRQEGTFQAFGQLNVTEGDYLFTAGEIFVRRFLIEGGTIIWDGDPINARLDLQAAYRTRASRAGLPGALGQGSGLIPLIVQMHITGRVEAPQVNLRLAVDRSINEPLAGYESLEALLNQPERAAEYATSVLLTNSFLLTTERTNPETLTSSGNQLAFNSLSQLIASQLNRYLSQVLPNVDLLLGVQGEGAQRLDVTYGVALRLLNERLIIRGQGVYRGENTANGQQNLLGEFIVEVRLTPSVSVQVFYRREDDVLNDYTLTSITGAGFSYQTDFPSWRRLLHRLFGWLIPDRSTSAPPPLTQVGNNSKQANVEHRR
ncbi:MAG: translocation/assembly module TamB domain-containing protein [Rhodothermus sp.]|nr:translocation/assembly module TamB domain-containing protein [Rhodothermus sp.]